MLGITNKPDFSMGILGQYQLHKNFFFTSEIEISLNDDTIKNAEQLKKLYLSHAD